MRGCGTAVVIALDIIGVISRSKKGVQCGNGDHHDDHIDDGNYGADDIQHRGCDDLQQHIIIALLADCPKQCLLQKHIIYYIFTNHNRQSAITTT